MSKLSQYLQEHLQGEVTDSLEVRRYFSIDASPLKIQPTSIIYPRSVEDIRKVMRFAWQLAERERRITVTARGNGKNTSGAAIGSGIILVMPKYLNRILELNPRKREVRVEPGMELEKLQQALYTHGLFLPVDSGQNDSSLAGLVASNAASGLSHRHGTTGRQVKSLQVVLGNGEIISTGLLDKRQLNQKLGLSNLEGEIYRNLDALLEENTALISEMKNKYKNMIVNSSGYNIFDISTEAGFDLTPLFVGSQGTLGIITEVNLSLEEHHPARHGCLLSLGRLKDLTKLLPKLLELEPAKIDFINHAAIEQVTKVSPHYFNDVSQLPTAAIHMWLEFNDAKENRQEQAVEEAGRLAHAVGAGFQAAHDVSQLESLRKVTESYELLNISASSRAVPLPLSDGAVPPVQLEPYLERIYQAYKSVEAVPAVWGSAAVGIVHVQLPVDLAQLGDRQRLFKLAEAIQRTTISLGGTTSAADGDGRMRADKIQAMYGKRLYEIMKEIKRIFDPYGVLNFGVKFGTANKDVKMQLNNSYNPHHRLD